MHEVVQDACSASSKNTVAFHCSLSLTVMDAHRRSCTWRCRRCRCLACPQRRPPHHRSHHRACRHGVLDTRQERRIVHHHTRQRPERLVPQTHVACFTLSLSHKKAQVCLTSAPLYSLSDLEHRPCRYPLAARRAQLAVDLRPAAGQFHLGHPVRRDGGRDAHALPDLLRPLVPGCASKPQRGVSSQWTPALLIHTFPYPAYPALPIPTLARPRARLCWPVCVLSAPTECMQANR